MERSGLWAFAQIIARKGLTGGQLPYQYEDGLELILAEPGEHFQERRADIMYERTMK